MNARAGWALIRSSWLSWMQYRSFFFLLAFGWMIPPLVYLLVWSAAAGEGQAGGLSRAEFAGYYLVLMVVNQLTYSQTNWTVGDEIRVGNVSTWLLRPMAALYHPLASEGAGKVVYLVFLLPVAFILALILRPEVPASPAEAALFTPALLGAWLLRFFWGYWLALLAFWATRADALLAVQDSLVFLLAGVVAPVGLLPAALQAIASVLPFRYMLGFPVEILTGQLAAGEIAAGFALQGSWLALSLGLTALLWRRGLRRFTAVGG